MANGKQNITIECLRQLMINANIHLQGEDWRIAHITSNRFISSTALKIQHWNKRRTKMKEEKKKQETSRRASQDAWILPLDSSYLPDPLRTRGLPAAIHAPVTRPHKDPLRSVVSANRHVFTLKCEVESTSGQYYASKSDFGSWMHLKKWKS